MSALLKDLGLVRWPLLVNGRAIYSAGVKKQPVIKLVFSFAGQPILRCKSNPKGSYRDGLFSLWVVSKHVKAF